MGQLDRVARAFDRRWALYVFAVLMPVILAACGSGGGGSSGTTGAGGPSIQSAPANQSVAEGESAVFTVVAAGTAPLTYQWQRNGQSIPGATSPVYVTPALGLSETGTQYSVAVNNPLGATASGPATVTVTAQAPSIVSQPQSQTVQLGASATFSVTARGSQPLAYRWQRDGVDIAGATASTYTTGPTTAADAGRRFRVIVSNSIGTATSAEATLIVNGAGAPVAIRFLSVGVASPGQRLIVSATLAGNPPFSYQWLRENQAVPGASGSSSSNTITYTTPTLTAADDASRYALQVSNAEGSLRTGDAIVHVLNPSRVAAGASHSLARTNNGATVYAWGDNTHGQLGIGSTTSTSTPTAITGLSGVTAVAAGAEHSLALKNDGTVLAWGRNNLGALGDGTQTSRTAPQVVPGLSNVVAVAAGNGRSFALRADGSVMAWGNNSDGALGIGSQNHVLVPTQVGAAISGFSNIVAIATGDRHALAVRSDGVVFGWGANDQGQLGAGASRNSPQAIAGATNMASVAAGAGFSLGLDVNGQLWSWGANNAGQLGTGSADPQALPTQITRTRSGGSFGPVIGLAAGRSHALARIFIGGLYAWGSDAQGQLGDGSASAGSNAPVPVSGVQFGAHSIAAGGEHSHAALDSGALTAWGANAQGQLGIGSPEPSRDAPTQIPALNLN